MWKLFGALFVILKKHRILYKTKREMEMVQELEIPIQVYPVTSEPTTTMRINYYTL